MYFVAVDMGTKASPASRPGAGSVSWKLHGEVVLLLGWGIGMPLPVR